MTYLPYTRREFLETLLKGIAAGSLFISAQRPGKSGIPTRPLGNTGEHVSIIALGGYDIARSNLTEAQSVQLMHEAIDEGVTFFDNCWEYHEGRSEEIMGKALDEKNKRDKVFLMTKVCGRDYKSAKNQLEDSLRRLRTDHIDLWQFHGIQWEDDPELIFDRENGAIRAALEAKEEGKIRFIGFTGHKHPRYHLAMLEQDFDFDTVQMPLNLVDPHYHSFQKQVLPEVRKKATGILGMKALASQNGRIPRELEVSAEICRRYVLSLPVSSLVCGINSRENLKQDVRMARHFKPLTEAEIRDLFQMSEEEGKDGHIEAYKTGNYGCDWYHDNRM